MASRDGWSQTKRERERERKKIIEEEEEEEVREEEEEVGLHGSTQFQFTTDG